MNRILVIGAGRSSASLIEYLKDFCVKNHISMTVADADIGLAADKIGSETPLFRAVVLDILREDELQNAIFNADIVISMVPAAFHPLIAMACIRHRRHMLSASYVSNEIKGMQEDAANAGILILKECGLDPGLDHMTAMDSFAQIKEMGGQLTSFKSFTGGLVAPASDTNPWNYKFSWNPRNVVLAGQGTASYIEKGEYKYIPYHKLFSRLEPIEVQGIGEFEGYANRDSLSYRSLYGIGSVPTILRGTIRRKGFSSAWNVFVQLGMTDDTYRMNSRGTIGRREFLNAFLPADASKTVEEKLCGYAGISMEGEEFKKIEWLGLFKELPLIVENRSPAAVLQELLEEKWRLGPEDTDMVIMQHKFEYSIGDSRKRKTATLVALGDDAKITAMAKTVGLPLGSAARLVIEGKINLKGVHIPVHPEIYKPILAELKKEGIEMVEADEDLD